MQGFFGCRVKKLRRRLQAKVKRALQSERNLRAANNRLQTITNGVPALIGYWNRNLRCEFANAAYREWYGLEPNRMVGMRLQDLLGEEIFAQIAPYARAALAGHEQEFERTLPRADGSIAHVEAHYTPDFDDHGDVAGFVVLVTDITDLHVARAALEAANAQLKSDSFTDFLTGLYNRRVFSQRSEEALTELKTSGKSYGLILMDLDDFKKINDKFGHAAGDDALCAVGRAVKAALHREADIPARLGGEEFAVLCFGDLDAALLHATAERIRTTLQSEKLPGAAESTTLTASFGIALGNAEDTDWRRIYARADGALYEAKVSGKNRVVFGVSTDGSTTGRLKALGFTP
jgi:diguanylate cyclase (GGDEF)-like protein/PAS domain S-box-containing protein